jgi:hypothetical protein
MLITLIDVVSCENPECREFARIVPNYAARTYYCPVCGQVSHTRTVDAALVARPQDYESYLCRHVTSNSSVWESS